MTDKNPVNLYLQSKEKWEQTTLQETLERRPERKQRFVTTSSTPVERVYTPKEANTSHYLENISLPGQYPFTRGLHATGYRGKLWTMRMLAGFGTAEETNERFKYLFEQGQTGLSIVLDMPTLYGYDTDAPEALGEFGKGGVAVSSLRDMEILLDGLPLDKITTNITINSPAAVLWAMYIAVADKQGIPRNKIGGTIQNDILKEYIAQKEFIFPPEPSMRLVTDTIEFGVKEVPRWNTISISGYHIREAGSTAAQELAFTLADGLEYVKWLIERGLAVDDFAPRLSFFFNAHNDFFEEIAKYRAARRVWAKVMKEKFGAQNPRSWQLRFHTQTAGATLTAQQPENNIARVAIQALAAVLGGTQSLHTNSMDEALALPSESAIRVALRTQQIIAHESGATNTVDPIGGSYFVEQLTDRLEAEAWDYFDKIEALGGVLPAIEAGFFQQAIADAAYRYQRELDDRERLVVGVNDFINEELSGIPIFKVDPRGYEIQCARIEAVKANRNNEAVGRCLTALRIAAEGTENLMPFIIDAVKEYATLQEIMDVFREVFGEYHEPAII